MGGETIWPTRPLKDCAVWYSGGTPNKATPRYWGGSIPWISARSLNDFFVSDSEDRVTEEGARNGTRLVPKDSILFIVRGMSLKSEFRMGIATRPVTFNQDLKALVAVDDVVPAYLAYAIRSKTTEILQMVGEAGHGTGVLPTDRIQALEIPVPSLEEQHAVAAIVGALDAKIELNRKMNATLEAMARALFKSWFVDFDPVRAKAEGRAPTGMDAETAKLFPSEFVESELGMIPKGWTLRVVGDLAVLSGGKQLERALIFDDGTIPVFGGAGVMGFTAGHNADGFVISVGRVGAYCGQFFAHRGKAWINNNASLIRPKNEHIAEWMFIALKHADIEVIKKGAAQPFVSNGDIANLKLLWPGEPTITAFSRQFVPLLNAKARNDAESTILARVRDELLPRLLSGELSVADAETAAEEVA